MTPFLFGQKLASQPSFWSDYVHQLNKFYNPWSAAWNEPARDGIEKGLQYVGRGAMGVGAGALAAAGGIAAAPAITSAGASVVPAISNAGNAAIGAASAGAAGLATQASKLPHTATNVVNSMSQFAARNPQFTSQIGRIAANDPGRIAPSLNNPSETVNKTVDNTKSVFSAF